MSGERNGEHYIKNRKVVRIFSHSTVDYNIIKEARLRSKSIMWMLSIFWFGIIGLGQLCLPHSVQASEKILSTILDSSQSKIIITPDTIVMLRDPSRAMSLADVQQANQNGAFQKLTKSVGLGYIKDAVWLRFKINHQEKELDGTIINPWILVVKPAYLDDIKLYTQGADGTHTEQISGDHIAYADRKTQHRHAIFNLHIQPGDTVLYSV
jgi:hypothetical protein